MRLVQTQQTFPLSSVKPLTGLMGYRDHCLAATRRALQTPTRLLSHSPVSGVALQPAGDVDGLAYLRDPEDGSLWLAARPSREIWSRLLADVSRYRHSPEAFHAGLVQSRADHVYAPKLEWIEDALQLQELAHPVLLEVVTPPSVFTGLLRESHAFADVITVDEMELAAGRGEPIIGQAAILLEALDRAHDPVALLREVRQRLAKGGLLFVTALVVSGFDLEVLGLNNLYLSPPDRANCFSLRGLETLLRQCGFTPVEMSTPGVLDLEIVRAHVERDPTLSLSPFERRLIEADQETREAFQLFLQQQGLSSFARIVARNTI